MAGLKNLLCLRSEPPSCKPAPIWDSHYGMELTLSQNVYSLSFGQYEHMAGSPLIKNQSYPLAG